LVPGNGPLHFHQLAVDQVLREGEAGFHAAVVLEHHKAEAPTAKDEGRKRENIRSRRRGRNRLRAHQKDPMRFSNFKKSLT
jgi:hypothetical protein